MKVLTILDTNSRYGTANHMLAVACGLAKRGMEVHAAFPKVSGTDSMISDCEAVGVTYWSLNGSFGKLPKLGPVIPCLRTLRLLSAVRPDVVQITAGVAGIWGPAMACAFHNAPTLVVFQGGSTVRPMSRLRLQQLSWARGRRQRWMAVSQQNQRVLQETYRTKFGEIGLLHNGIDISLGNRAINAEAREVVRREVREELQLPLESKLLMTTARLDSGKGHSDLLEIMPAVIKEFPEARFLWAGDGKHREDLESQARREGVADYVRFLGYRGDVIRLLHASDLLVFPSHAEGGCSSAIREAMVHKLPIVCSDAGGIPEVVHHQVHGLVFPLKDTKAMMVQLREALRDLGQMRHLADQARKRIEEFSSERMIENYFSVFRELAAAGQRHGLRGDSAV